MRGRVLFACERTIVFRRHSVEGSHKTTENRKRADGKAGREEQLLRHLHALLYSKGIRIYRCARLQHSHGNAPGSDGPQISARFSSRGEKGRYRAHQPAGEWSSLHRLQERPVLPIRRPAGGPRPRTVGRTIFRRGSSRTKAFAGWPRRNAFRSHRAENISQQTFSHCRYRRRFATVADRSLLGRRRSVRPRPTHGAPTRNDFRVCVFRGRSGALTPL